MIMKEGIIFYLCKLFPCSKFFIYFICSFQFELQINSQNYLKFIRVFLFSHLWFYFAAFAVLQCLINWCSGRLVTRKWQFWYNHNTHTGCNIIIEFAVYLVSFLQVFWQILCAFPIFLCVAICLTHLSWQFWCGR